MLSFFFNAFFYFSKIELVLHDLFFNTIVEIYSVSVHVALEYNFSDPNVLPWGFPSDSEGKVSACNARDLPCGFLGWSEDKVSACNAGNLGLIPRSGRSPGEGKGNPLQYSCLENAMDRRDILPNYIRMGINLLYLIILYYTFLRNKDYMHYI